ncbi:MAG TPA: histidine kinase [Acidimicrobiia bacterium]|nr:histidine kinase [Acidimicrobiia bacterium]
MTSLVPAPWEFRLHRSVTIGQFVALIVAVVIDLVQTGGHSESLFAMAVASMYVLGTAAVPESWYRIRFGAEAITLIGAFLTITAITLTGGPSSPYLLLSMGPPIFATIYGGLRTGLTTGFLSAGLLALITLAQGVPFIDALPGLALYMVFVLLVAVIRRLLEDIHRQASELAVEKESATQKLETLEEIHGVLLRLSEDISAGRLNAVEVAAETLEAILARIPGSSGRLEIEDQEGSVVLASRGVPPENPHTNRIPLSTADSQVGALELLTPDTLSRADLTDIAAFVQPVSIAFANLQLLQDIVGSAVAEERIRLAREMHDDIGPSLASLGLALDMAAMQQAGHPELSADLKVLRSNVTKLVEDVRASVADLRTAPGPTLTARLLQSTARLDGDPPVVVDLDERRPPRPAVIGDLDSIITEATRNAYFHAGASKILISGRIDRSNGVCSVIDDGKGFDPSYEPHGHFGLMGMRERAEKIGAKISFQSEPGVGTTVTVEWGNR